MPNCFCREAAETGAIRLRSSGRQHRDFIGLASLASRIAGVVANPAAHRNQIYIVGSGDSITIAEVADRVASRYECLFGRACELRMLSDQPSEAQPLQVRSARSAAAGLLAPPAETLDDEIDAIFRLLKGS